MKETKTKKKAGGAACPNCGTRWWWDSCNFVYQNQDGKYCEAFTQETHEQEFYHYFCHCGEWLTTLDEMGDESRHAVGFGIDWDTVENSVSPC